MDTEGLTLQQSIDKKDLERQVKSMYTEVANNPEGSYHFETGHRLAQNLGYSPIVLDIIPAAAVQSFAGVGYHFDLANLQPGEKVLDLGSGSGTDVFYASEQVGGRGEVYGLEMTEAQIQKSLLLKREGHYKSVQFLEGYIEEIPLADSTVDAIISNGVINLSSEKEKVFSEAFRVLEKGGRLALSDIVGSREFPPEIKCNATLWAACVAGAIPQQEYLDLIESVGFRIEAVKSNDYSFVSNRALSATKNYGISSISVLARKL